MILPIFLATLGCGDPAPDAVAPVVPEDGITLLEPRGRLIRLSMDLRGRHPTEVELAAIDANPDLYEGFVDRYLADPEFLDRIETIYNRRFLTRTGDTYNLEIPDRGVNEEVLADSINDEPLELVRKIVAEDLPWTEVVLADYTMSDPVTAALWGTDRPKDAEGWVEAHYQDGRDHAGILSMTTTWTRYPSAGVNANRHRANATSRLLLCDDYLSRPVSFNRSQIDAITSGDPEDIIAQTPTCQSCHSSLDPLSANFFGFFYEIEGDFVEQTTYRPEDEMMWKEYSGRAPGYFGTPTWSLRELADNIAEDGRFADCAVKTIFEGITQRTIIDADWTELTLHKQVFVDGGLRIKPLVKSIVTSREYLAKTIAGERGEHIPTVKMADPGQLAGAIQSSTGYRWTFGGRDGLRTNDLGLVILGGGIDSRYVTTPSFDPSVGTVFIQERLAQAAAYQVAQHDLAKERPDAATLLRYVTIDDTPENNPKAFEAQIRSLYLDVTGIPLPAPKEREDGSSEQPPEIAELQQLWKQMYAVNASPQQAWAGVVSVVLRDPSVLFY